jgi:hypothetical protein
VVSAHWEYKAFIPEKTKADQQPTASAKNVFNYAGKRMTPVALD